MNRIHRKRILGVEIEAHPIVFPAAALSIIVFVVAAAIEPGRAAILFDWLQQGIADRFAWLYTAAMNGFLVFAVYLCFSRYGSIRLGPDDVEPEFPRVTWFAMLFSAGMGIGMLFFGVAEPMWHFLSPPAGAGGTLDAARSGMGITLFHWCLHPWSLYAVVALALSYFAFRRGLPLSFRSAFYPLIGDRIHGPIGNTIDLLAVLATLFGLATSLGLGAKQVNAGLNFVFGLPQGAGIQVVLIACITSMAVASLVSGLHAGIRRLSELNMVLASLLLLFLFVAGPTGYLLNSLIANAGTYIQDLPRNSFRSAAYSGRSTADWLKAWTVFYWGWWISWSPFVGMFIARISKGRTIREFVVGVLLVPSAVATVWMTGFGNSALHQEISEHVSADAGSNGTAFRYESIEYPVQVPDESTGLPIAADGEWLVGPHAKSVATPVGVLMKQDEEGLVTKSGDAVEYLRGVLVHRGTRDPYVPDDESRHAGPYRSSPAELSLGGYLSNPVLSDDRTRLIDTTATAMFVMLDAYPLSTITALIGTLSVILFFVTSSDSASLVADIIASGGSQNPTTGTRLFWGILEGVLAAVLLIAGGLKALQTGSITIGLPFCVVVIVMCYGLHRGLRSELEDGST